MIENTTSRHELDLGEAYTRLRAALAALPPSSSDATPPSPAVLPTAAALAAATASLPDPRSPAYLRGVGARAALDHVLADVMPAVTGQSRSGRYYGFVTGSALPVAEAADNVVSALDQNVQVHLPAQTATTEVEDAALRMLVALLRLGPDDDDDSAEANLAAAAAWPGRTFTTGATASNILGLACGREAVIDARLPPGAADWTVARAGLLDACAAAGVRCVRVLTSMGHSSLSKAASVAGLGWDAVVELPASADEPWRLDLDAVERELAREGAACIVVVSAGEVNTGRFATRGRADMRRLRALADRHRAWIHVDGAFGVFARALPGGGDDGEFVRVREYAAGLELADSITADGHKLLNVPYDCGVFLCRHAGLQSQVFANPNAVYLASSQDGSQVPSPLNIGLENSRRFRALPVYATLLSEGREGMAAMFARMVRLARGLSEFVRQSPDYELLPSQETGSEHIHIIVLFRAKDEGLNDVLVQKINDTRQMYVSGTKWKGQKACRIAVSSWRVDVETDLRVVTEILASIARESS